MVRTTRCTTKGRRRADAGRFIMSADDPPTNDPSDDDIYDELIDWIDQQLGDDDGLDSPSLPGSALLIASESRQGDAPATGTIPDAERVRCTSRSGRAPLGLDTLTKRSKRRRRSPSQQRAS